jgi:hypothetical protein
MQVVSLWASKKYWLGLAALLALLAGAAPAVSAETAMVVTDGANLRAKGGQAYQQAATVDVLNQGDYVRIFNKEGNYTQVETPAGLMGWVESRQLQGAPDKVKPLPLSQEWRASLEDFLGRFRQAVKSGQFQNLAALLSPRGLILERRSFPDAVKNPSSQAKVVVPLWYASDVSLTYGSAWELLMQGTNPSKATAYFDEAADEYRLGQAGAGRESFPLLKEGPLLPAHLKALSLANPVYYLEGFPKVLEGFPEPQSFMEEPQTVPFALVYKVGKDSYLLRTLKGVGLVMVITARPGEGWRVRALHTQAP